MALPDLTGQNIENTYNRVVQTDGTFFYDGTGSLLNLGPINTGSFATTGSNTFNGNQTITGSLVVTQGANVTLSTGTGILYRNGTTSVDWRNRTLNNGAESVILDWENNLIYDTTSNPSIDWENRVLWDLTGGAESIDYGRRRLYNSSGDVTLDYNTGVLTGTASFAASGGTPIYQLNSQTLDSGSWALSGSYYTYNYTNANIASTSRVDFTPNNASIDEVSSCRMLPQVTCTSGTSSFFATFPPQSNIVGDITIFTTTAI